MAGQQEFRAVEADPLGAGIARVGEIIGKLDVGIERDTDAVGRGRRTPAVALAMTRRAVVGRGPLGERQCLRVGVDDDGVLGAVDDHHLPWLDPIDRAVQADDGWHLERACQDGGVVGSAARIGREATHLGPVDLGDERRREFIGNQHRRFLERAQQVARRRDVLSQVHLQAANEIGDVALSFAQVRVGNLIENGAELVEHLLDRPLGIHQRVAHQRFGPRHEHRVVEHQQLRVEQRGQFRPAAPADAGANVL